MTQKHVPSRVHDACVSAAHEGFGMGGTSWRGQRRGAANPLYVDSPVHLAPVASTSSGGQGYLAGDPIGALVPEIAFGRPVFGEIPQLPPPYVAFVIGQYGVGKTELIHQLGAAAEHAHASGRADTTILPIVLAECRSDFEAWRSNSNPQDASRVFFGRIWRETSSNESALLEQISEGKVVVALDGLDELITDFDEFAHFLDALSAFFNTVSTVTSFASPRIIITARLEFLDAFGMADGKRIRTRLTGTADAPNIHFLRLDLFGESETLAYLTLRLKQRVSDFEGLLARVRRPEILRMLQRPLLLRMFCDICEGTKQTPAFLQDDRQHPSPATLIGAFVDNAIDDDSLMREQKGILGTKVLWSKDALADQTARLYQEARRSFTTSEVREFIAFQPDASVVPDDDHYLLALHKCPFLLVNQSAKTAEFSHRVFLEYFTALGLWQSQVRANDARKTGGDAHSFPLFDELVLNVDMRKLLRGIVVTKLPDRPNAWYDQTRNSYGLNEVDNWHEPPNAQTVNELDVIRQNILDIMTEADESVRDRAPHIREFFRLTAVHFHPRYALFNYEGIAIYISLFRHRSETQRISESFSDHLWVKLDEALARLGAWPDDEVLRRPYELLVERILSISIRLDYEWIDRRLQLLKDCPQIKSQDVQRRMRTLIEQYDRLSGR
jgi:hypothetical protein